MKCSVEKCEHGAIARGLCGAHYVAERKYGDPLKGKKHKDRLIIPRICMIAGCQSQHQAKGYCLKHYKKYLKYDDPLSGKEIRAKGDGCISAGGYIRIQKNYKTKSEHFLVAEKAYGKKLPYGVQIHHVDENRLNNSTKNLVICPNQAYHKLLHVRMNAFAACGNVNFRKCSYCKKYDDPSNLKHKKKQYANSLTQSVFHADCANTYDRKRKSQKRKSDYENSCQVV